MTLEGQKVLSCTVYAELSSNVLGRDAHRHEAVVGGLALEDFISKQVRVDLIGHDSVGHGLEATADTARDLTSADGVGNSGDSLETGRAETVDTGDASGFRVASHEASHTGLSGSGAWVEHVSNDNVLDESLVDSGLLSDGSEAGPEHGLESSGSLRTSLSAGHSGTGHANDDNVVVTLGSD